MTSIVKCRIQKLTKIVYPTSIFLLLCIHLVTFKGEEVVTEILMLTLNINGPLSLKRKENLKWKSCKSRGYLWFCLKKKEHWCKNRQITHFHKNYDFCNCIIPEYESFEKFKRQVLTGVNASYQWLALRSLMHQCDQECFFLTWRYAKTVSHLVWIVYRSKHCQKSYRYNKKKNKKKKNMKMRKYRALFSQRHVIKTT